MPGQLRLKLTQEQRAELCDLRDHAKLPYLRERAAAILRVADGWSGQQTAREGLLRPRYKETVCEWVKRYRKEGAAGLIIRPGRGRKPAYFPTYPNAETAQEALTHIIHQSPKDYGQSGTRWTMKSLLTVGRERGICVSTTSGMHQICTRLKVKRKRARHHVHSPDPHYKEKLTDIRSEVDGLKTNSNKKYVLVYLDEFTLYRHPSLANAYACSGKEQPLAEIGLSSNKTWRYVAALDVLTGKVTFLQSSKIGVKKLVEFYQQLAKAYPDTEIDVVCDNWPVHFHPDVVAVLQPQEFPYGAPKPPNWSAKARANVERLNLPIHLMCLPTYAPWTNPIEKLWRLLKDQVLHLHQYGDDWDGLKRAVQEFLEKYASASPDLLQYVGLSELSKLYRALFIQVQQPQDLSIQSHG